MIALVVTLLLFTSLGCALLSFMRRETEGSPIEILAEALLAGVAVGGGAGFALGVAGVPLTRLTWILLAVAAMGITIVRRRSARVRMIRVRPSRGLLAVAMIPIAFVLFDAAMLPLHDYDGRTFWIVKAKAIAHEASVSGPFFQGEGTENLHSRYPLLMPVAAAGVFSLSGSLDDRVVRSLYALVAIAFAMALRRRIRERVSSHAADVVFAVVLWLPQFSFAADGGATSAYSDIAVAAFAGLAFFELLEARLSSTFGLWCAALILTKNEGLPLAIVLLLIALVLHRGALLRRGIALPVAAWLLLSMWRRGVPLEHDENYTALARALPERLAALTPASGELLLRAIDLRMWGLFWIAVLVGALLAMRKQTRGAAAASASILGGVAAYVAAYAVTNWVLSDLAASSAHRLLLQLVGPATYLLASGFADSAARSDSVCGVP